MCILKVQGSTVTANITLCRDSISVLVCGTLCLVHHDRIVQPCLAVTPLMHMYITMTPVWLSPLGGRTQNTYIWYSCRTLARSVHASTNALPAAESHRHLRRIVKPLSWTGLAVCPMPLLAHAGRCRRPRCAACVIIMALKSSTSAVVISTPPSSSVDAAALAARNCLHGAQQQQLEVDNVTQHHIVSNNCATGRCID